MTISVVIVDDQAMVRQGFGALLDAQPDISVVGEAAATILSSPSPTRPRVLMLTTVDIDDYVYEALRLGASGSMLKDAPADELVRAVRVVAGGRSNAEIAGELFLAEQTVRTHVSRVLAKLGLRDRAQAVVFAYEHGVVVPGA